MATEQIQMVKSLVGKPLIPGDKSISHRALLFGAMAHGTTEIKGLLEGGDVRSTAHCLKALGVQIEKTSDLTLVHGQGFEALKKPGEILDCGNSGSTMRMLMGILAARPFESTLSGDVSLVKRPMKRVAEPLELMGAKFQLTNGQTAPLKILGCSLHGVQYQLKVASAQIKTAIMLAALQAEGTTKITGEIQSRDHSERMLRLFGAQVEVHSNEIIIPGKQKLRSAKIEVPGDPSTAAFWLAGAALLDGSHIEMKNISLNPTRTGFLKVLISMGCQIEVNEIIHDPEPIGHITIKSGPLKSFTIEPELVPSLVDEVPLLAVLATQAHGQSVIRGAEELRVKESDRIEAVAHNLRAMGAKITVLQDGFIIDGPQKLHGANIETFHDHRIAMAFSIAGLVATTPTTILDSECASISYPDFYKTLRELSKNV